MAAQDPNAPTDSNGSALVATAVTMLTFSWLSVGLRSFVRAKLTNGFQWDDWVMLAAQVRYQVESILDISYSLLFQIGKLHSLMRFDITRGSRWVGETRSVARPAP